MDNEWKYFEIIININILVICYFVWVFFLKILYRLLRVDEDFVKGLIVKDLNFGVIVDFYVLYGLYGFDLRYIFCSKILEGINEFVFYLRIFLKRIVRLKINENDLEIKGIIDLIDFYELYWYVFI